MRFHTSLPRIVMCLITLATSARLPGDGGHPEQRPLIVSSVSLPGEQQNGLASPLTPETKGESVMNLADGDDRTDGDAGKTTGSISFISTLGGESIERGYSSDSASNEGHGNKHDSRTGYKSDNRYKEYFYYDHAGYGDNRFDHKRDDLIDFIHPDNRREKSAKELTDWDSYYVLKSRGQDCNDGDGGAHSCLQDSEDEDTDDSDECAHDDEDCDDSEARLRAYLERDEDEEEGSEIEVEDEDDEYLLNLKLLGNGNDNDYENYDVNEEDNDDDNDDDVYMYVDDNDTNLLSFFDLSNDPKESNGALLETEKDKNEEPVTITEAESKKYVPTGKADQSYPGDKSENVPEEMVARSNRDVACNDTGHCLGGIADDGEAAEDDASYVSRKESSPLLGSNMQHDPSLANDTPTIAREKDTDAEYIGQNKLHDVFRKFKGPISKEDEQGQATVLHAAELTSGRFENTAPAVSVTETVNSNLNASPKAITKYDHNLPFVISEHDTTPYEEIYDTIMHSGQVSDEEKTHIASLEQMRRFVNRVGGFETLLEKPEVHHIVKRQTNGGEACVLLRRRRRRAADEAGETERALRTRRGIGNVGRNLEQGNPRFRQLFSQYRTMCDFLSMAVFEK